MMPITVALTVTVLALTVPSYARKYSNTCDCAFGMRVCENDNVAKVCKVTFPGLFVTNGELSETIKGRKRHAKITKYLILSDSGEFVDPENYQQNKQLEGRKKRSDDGCCQTDVTYIAPLMVTYEDGTEYPVVHDSHGFQVLAVGYCRSNTGCGGSYCTEESRLHWVLIDDPASGWLPPVRFIPVAYPSHCVCVYAGK